MGFLYGFDNTSSRLQFRLLDLLNRLLKNHQSSIEHYPLVYPLVSAKLYKKSKNMFKYPEADSEMYVLKFYRDRF